MPWRWAHTPASSLKLSRYLLPSSHKCGSLPIPGHPCGTSVIPVGVSTAALSHPGRHPPMARCLRAGRKHQLQLQPAQESWRHLLERIARKGLVLSTRPLLYACFGMTLHSSPHSILWTKCPLLARLCFCNMSSGLVLHKRNPV